MELKADQIFQKKNSALESIAVLNREKIKNKQKTKLERQ